MTLRLHFIKFTWHWDESYIKWYKTFKLQWQVFLEAHTPMLMNEEMNFDKMNGFTDGSLLGALTNRCLSECSARPLCILGFIISLANSYHLVCTCSLEALDEEADNFFPPLPFFEEKKPAQYFMVFCLGIRMMQLKSFYTRNFCVCHTSYD